MNKIIGILCALFVLSAHAAVDVAGVKFDDTTHVGEHTLALNGAGLRKKFFFKVYAAGLYLPQKSDSAAAVLGQERVTRIDIVTLRDLTAKQFADALEEGLKKNLSASELTELKPPIDQFIGNLLAIKSAEEGTRILIDYLPGTGTTLTVSGRTAGQTVPGARFFNALLRVWIGDKPAQEDLKQALLGRK